MTLAEVLSKAARPDGGLGGANWNGGPLASLRNRVINGDFDIWQRGVSLSVPGPMTYLADRWASLRDGGGTLTVSRQTHTLGQAEVPGNPKYFARFQQTAAQSSASFNEFRQHIEGAQTLAGRKITGTFYARAGAPINLHRVRLRQRFGAGGSPSADVDIDVLTGVPIGTSWTKVQFTFDLPSVVGKTLGTNSNDHLQFIIGLPINTTFTVDISHVSVVEGDATAESDPFSPRHMQQELALCQRYFTTRAIPSGSSSPLAVGYIHSSTSVRLFIPTPVPLRVTPSLSISGTTPALAVGSGSVTPSNLAVVRAVEAGVDIIGDVSGQTAGAIAVLWQTGVTISLDAEL